MAALLGARAPQTRSPAPETGTARVFRSHVSKASAALTHEKRRASRITGLRAHSGEGGLSGTARYLCHVAATASACGTHRRSASPRLPGKQSCVRQAPQQTLSSRRVENVGHGLGHRPEFSEPWPQDSPQARPHLTLWRSGAASQGGDTEGPRQGQPGGWSRRCCCDSVPSLG